MLEINTKQPDSILPARAKAIGVSVVAAAGLGLGVARAKEAYHPQKSPAHTQKFEHAGAEHNATFYANVGGETKPQSHLDNGHGGEAVMVQPNDTEFVMAHKIAPDRDPRAVADEIDKVLPNDSRHQNHMLQPGDSVEYGPDGHVTGYTPAESSNG